MNKKNVSASSTKEESERKTPQVEVKKTEEKEEAPNLSQLSQGFSFENIDDPVCCCAEKCLNRIYKQHQLL